MEASGEAGDTGSGDPGDDAGTPAAGGQNGETPGAPSAAAPRRPGKRPRKRPDGAPGKKSARPRKRKNPNPLAAFSEDDAEESRRLRARRRKRLSGARSKSRDAQVKPSPPLTETDPLGRYMAGEMVPCPVGCGGFSEVVHVGTQPSGAGEVYFECLSCAQRKSFEVEKPSAEEIARIKSAAEAGGEVYCPRCSRNAILRRRGKQLVCPDCGVMVQI